MKKSIFSFSFILVFSLIFLVSTVFAAGVEDDLHLNIQVLEGNVLNGGKFYNSWDLVDYSLSPQSDLSNNVGFFFFWEVLI